MTSPAPETRVCSVCEKEVLVSQLAKKTPRGKHYKRSWCKSCEYKKRSASRKRNPERRARDAAKNLLRNKRPERRLKVLARAAVMNALRSGKLIKQACEVCGCSQTEGHHDDYTKPIDVRWLCQEHHRMAHRRDP